jgi:hypothetical protein
MDKYHIFDEIGRSSRALVGSTPSLQSTTAGVEAKANASDDALMTEASTIVYKGRMKKSIEYVGT